MVKRIEKIEENLVNNANTPLELKFYEIISGDEKEKLAYIQSSMQEMFKNSELHLLEKKQLQEQLESTTPDDETKAANIKKRLEFLKNMQCKLTVKDLKYYKEFYNNFYSIESTITPLEYKLKQHAFLSVDELKTIEKKTEYLENNENYFNLLAKWFEDVDLLRRLYDEIRVEAATAAAAAKPKPKTVSSSSKQTTSSWQTTSKSKSSSSSYSSSTSSTKKKSSNAFSNLMLDSDSD